MQLHRVGRFILQMSVLGFLGLISHQTPASAQETHLTMQSEPKDYIGQAQYYSYSASDGTFSVTAGDGDGNGTIDSLRVSYNSATWDHWWYLNFSALAGQTVTTGLYDNATRALSLSTTNPGLDVYGDGRGSNELNGSFYIDQLDITTVDGQPVVNKLVVSFVQYSEHFPYAFRGTLYYNGDPVVEQKAPVTKLTQFNQYQGGPVLVALTGVDDIDGSGVKETRYSVDGGAEQSYAAPFSLADGSHTVAFYSVDWAGNSEALVTQNVVVDSTPPSVAANFSGNQGSYGWYSGPVTVSFTADDGAGGSGVAAVYYSLDFGPYQTYTTPVTVQGDGYHYVSYYAVDNAGNSSYGWFDQFAIDSVAPAVQTSTAIQSVQTRPTYSVVVTVTGRIDEWMSGLDPYSPAFSVKDEYGTDQPSGAVKLYQDGSYSFTVVLPGANPKDKDGRHYSITVSAKDYAGNTGSASAAVLVTKH